MALGALEIEAESRDEFLRRLRGISQTLAATRPTARNLFRAIDRMEQAATVGKDVEQTKKALIDEAIKLHSEEVEATRKLSQLGAELIKDGFTILTHCNAGPLATTGYGTALGVIKWAKEQGKKIKVLATETRPLLQGARITTWELKKAGIPVTLITDSMAGYFMSRGEVSCVIVGADRIASNGDTANKIGTYTLAVLAKENGIPFYVAAPTSTIDLSLASGEEIPIEQRSPQEITHIQGVSIAPEGISAANPAFDVSPHKYITAIITERGIIKELYVEGIKRIR
ncbi:Methylthioribose-1-phosphate isomerase [subsurface metagenome]